MFILILLSIHTLFCVWRVYVLVEVGTFLFIFEMERFWRSKGKEKLYFFHVFWKTQGCSKTSKLLRLLRGGKLGGSLQILLYIYVKDVMVMKRGWDEMKLSIHPSVLSSIPSSVHGWHHIIILYNVKAEKLL